MSRRILRSHRRCTAGRCSRERKPRTDPRRRTCRPARRCRTSLRSRHRHTRRRCNRECRTRTDPRRHTNRRGHKCRTSPRSRRRRIVFRRNRGGSREHTDPMRRRNRPALRCRTSLRSRRRRIVFRYNRGGSRERTGPKRHTNRPARRCRTSPRSRCRRTRPRCSLGHIARYRESHWQPRTSREPITRSTTRVCCSCATPRGHRSASLSLADRETPLREKGLITADTSGLFLSCFLVSGIRSVL